MMKITFTIIGLMLFLLAVTNFSSAGDAQVPDRDTILKLIVQPDVDMSVFDGGQLYTALTDIIDNYDGDYRDRYVKAAIGWLRVTGEDASVDYLKKYMDQFPMECLNGLGYFSTVDSYKTLAVHLKDDDEYNRRFAVESLGKLDFTVSDEMWASRDEALGKLLDRMANEKKDWILPVIQQAIDSVTAQAKPQKDLS